MQWQMPILHKSSHTCLNQELIAKKNIKIEPYMVIYKLMYKNGNAFFVGHETVIDMISL